MKKFIKKMKGKKVLSLVLAAIMLATTFNIALPMLKLDASAAGSITTTDGETVTQTKIVGETTRYTTYDNYAARFLNGASNPTNMVIPGLSNSADYVVQGMSYYPQKDWMLITAYHGDSAGTGTVKSSKLFAIDAATGNFVAMFDFYNPGTNTHNTEHGGGIAISEHNIYYACGDDDREIAYAPLSQLDLAEGQTYKTIQLVASADFNEIGSVTVDGKTGYTAYVCYDNGVLWTGNFYDKGAQILPGMDFTSIANGYNAPSNSTYNSMVYGYRLSGNTSEEEWANLVNASNDKTKDCRGIPSYAIGLNNAIKDVQYAVVDNGKLYLSCSFGTGEGTMSVSYAGMNPYSTLVVADIDLSQPGTVPIDIRTHLGAKTINAYNIEKYDSFNMMPMSEGLCVVNDNIFITFESASYKYREKAGIMGNCGFPVDVVWQLDPYELMETTVAEPEKSIYYEKVYGPSDIVDGDEYIIVYESDVKDPVTQKNYLYALNAKGNFKGLELSKSSTDVVNGYDGMIGHPISYYSFEKGVNGEDILYLERPQEDDIANIRWTIDQVSGTNYSIKNTSTYFANCNSFYFDQNKITMLPSNSTGRLSNIKLAQLVADSGYFILSNADTYYLWCNDGLDAARNTKANTYYSNNASSYPIMDGITETSGTFHCDALNLTGANIIGDTIDKGDAVTDQNERYKEGAFQIYRRFVDEAASTYESRVYTDLDAELQEDGTYNVTLETYAISPNHYQYVGEKPTDYIIIADASSSMSSGGSTGITEFTTPLKVGSMISDRNNIAKTDDACVVGYAFSSTSENIHFKHAADNKYYKGYMAVRNDYEEKWYGKSFIQFYYVYYIADDGYYYCLTNLDNEDRQKYTEAEFKEWVAGNKAVQTASSTRSNIDTGLSSSQRIKEEIVNTVHYRFDDATSSYAGEYTRISTFKNAASNLVDQIAAQNSSNRIALVQYGSSTSYLGASGWTSSGYTDAFWNAASNASNLKTQLGNISTAAQTDNSGMEFTIANNIIENGGIDYTVDGNKERNLAIIFFSDGIPGADGGSSATAAANAVIQKALTAKNKGAFIYTVLIGNNSASGFNKKAYMDGVSSKYAAAESLDTLGGQSVDGVNYALSLATTTANNYFNFGAITTQEVAHNAAVFIDNLDADSYLRQQLNDAFKFPEDFNKDTDLIVELINGEYDEIGRFSFNEAGKSDNETDATTIKNATEVDTTNKILTVTKYDYADEYVARNRTDKDGRKLRVVLKGLLADETAKIQNTSINNTDTTALYKTKSDMDNSNEATDLSFKKLPTSYFNIPEYTYVLDYGLKMLDTEVNGTLKSVSADLSAQRDSNGDLAYKDVSENGLVQIADNDLDLLYHTTPTNFADSGYCLIQRDDGTYDWFEIKVVPASNVYFEEADLNVKTDDDKFSSKVAWTDAGEATNTHRELDAEGDVVGYNKTYDVAGATYSNGNALTATVTASQRNSQIQTFDFVGTGVDIVSCCDSNTGMLLVNVKKKSDGKSVAAKIVDTYCAEGTFNQTPVFHWSIYDDDVDGVDNKGTTYGTYTVEISALYLTTAGALNTTRSFKKSNLIDTGLEMKTSTDVDTTVLQAMLDDAGVEDVSAKDVELVWFDDNSIFNGGTGVAPTKNGSRADGTGTVQLVNYIDGFRVYNPLGNEVTESYDPYANYSDTEKNVSYVNVSKNLSALSTDNGTLGDIAYITGVTGAYNFATYQKKGPKGELYLDGLGSDNTTGISFKIDVAAGERVMLGLRAVNGPASISVNDGTGVPWTATINSATEMYYDITNCIDNFGEDKTITVVNNGSTILAVNHIKFSGGPALNGSVNNGARSLARSNDATAITSSAFLPITQEDLAVIDNSMSGEPILAEIINGVLVPIVEEEEIPGDNTNNDDTNTEEDEKEVFSISSIIEMIIALIEKILYNAFGINKIA